MLRLRFADDTWRAYPYYTLGGMAYDPVLGIELTFHDSVVNLRGRNLFPLFTLIGDHAVRWCWEAGRSAWLQVPEHEPAIERLEIKAPKTKILT